MRMAQPNEEMELLEGTRVSAQQAGYLELPGAKKDGDCRTVEVEGGISKDLGCCNQFGWNSKTEKKFSCGTCEYVKEKSNAS